jgi:signal transduction histidine kinase
MSTPSLLPTEVAAGTSRWFGRARNYPIFSLPWFRYRSIAMLTGALLIVALFLAMSGWNRLGVAGKAIDIAKAVEGALAYLLTVAALCLVGPGLAVLVRRKALRPRFEIAAIAAVLLLGIATSAAVWTLASMAYERPVFDSGRDVLVQDKLLFVNFDVDARVPPTLHVKGLRDPVVAARYFAAWQEYARQFGMAERLVDGWPPFIDAADRRLVARLRDPGTGAAEVRRLQTDYVALLEKVARQTIDLVQRARGAHGMAALSRQQQAASDALVDAMLAAPLPLSPGQRDAGKRAGEFAGLVQALAFFALLAWLGGIFDLPAFVRQRGMLGDVHARQELARAHAARNSAELRLSVLAAQVEPHFLFNTLASVRSAIATDPQRASAIVDHMVDYLRHTIPRMRDDGASATVALATQLSAASAYLALMQARMPRLQCSVTVEPGLEQASIPPLMLISLVENAVKHGIEPKPGPAHIAITARRVQADDAALLEVSVSDDGIGFGAAASGSGIGLANIQERLRSYYGRRAGLELGAGTAGGVTATLRLPLSFEP